MEEERVMEQRIDFAVLSLTAEHTATAMARVHMPSMEEQYMWDNHALFNEPFDAGDHTSAAVDERKRLEREATDFDLWNGADFVLEEDPTNGELLLDELEQDDILTELLRNACVYIQLWWNYRFESIFFGQIWTHQMQPIYLKKRREVMQISLRLPIMLGRRMIPRW
jgi:hypothetical protein